MRGKILTVLLLLVSVVFISAGGSVKKYSVKNAVKRGERAEQLINDDRVTTSTDKAYKYRQTRTMWAAVGVRPSGPFTDFDIILYEDTLLTDSLKGSFHGAGQIDFIVRDYNHVSVPNWEGIYVNKYGGPGFAYVEYEDDVEELSLNPGYYEDTWPYGDVVEIYDAVINEPGLYTFSVDITQGSSSLDLGIGIFDSQDETDFAMSFNEMKKYSDEGGNGDSESFSVFLNHPDHYGLILWANNTESGNIRVQVSEEGDTSKLVYDQHEIDDDNVGSSSGDSDSLPEAGEVIELPVLLKNTGTSVAYDVHSYLHTEDEYITLIDSLEYWPSILPGDSSWCFDDFDFSIDPGSPPHEAVFYMNIFYNDMWRTDTFRMQIYTENACSYLGRCADSAYLYFQPDPYTSEATKGLYDGEGIPLTTIPPTYLICFMMDMGGVIWYSGEFPAIYSFGMIVAYDPFMCDTVYTIRLPLCSTEEHYSGLAYDPSDNSFWYTIYERDSLYHIRRFSDSIHVFPAHRNISGLALDSRNNYLWAIIRGDPDKLVLYNIAGGAPFQIRGPFPVPWYDSGGASGLDFDENRDRLIALNTNDRSVWYFPHIDKMAAQAYRFCWLFEEFPDTPSGIATLEGLEAIFVSGNTYPFTIDKYGLITDVNFKYSTISEATDNTSSGISELSLSCSPNPFVKTVEIRYQLAEPSPVVARIFDAAGRLVKPLLEEMEGQGSHVINWDGKDQKGHNVAPGIYFCHFRTGKEVVVRKLLLIK